MFVSLGTLQIEEVRLKIIDYPFEPSIAYSKTDFEAKEIENIDYSSSFLNIKIGDELIYVSSEYKEQLKEFAKRCNITAVRRPWIWEAILEPFLDTEYTKEKDSKLKVFLQNHGLTSEEVKSIRTEIESQMIKYNFDSMLWEWVSLGTPDVLRAMRKKYNKEQFYDFYHKAMKIALLNEQTNDLKNT